MNKNNIVLLFFLMLIQMAFGQIADEKLIHGKIVSDSNAVQGVDIVNLVNEKATVTDNNGEFFILAKADDLLVISNPNFEIKRKLIDAEDLKSEIIIITIIPKGVELDEVIVKDKSEGTSIIPGVKKLTPAERKLYTARSGILDRPLNWMSGRTAMLKKEVAVERKERLLHKIETIYDDKFYIETLKIPAEYIKDFQYYAIEYKAFVTEMKAKNKTMMQFLIGKLAVNYNQIIANAK